MNTLILACLVYLVCSALGGLGSEVTFSSGLSPVTGGAASGEGLPIFLEEDEELETSEDLPGGAEAGPPSHARKIAGDERRKRNNKGKGKGRHRSKATTASDPGHSSSSGPGHYSYASASTPGRTAAEDPCTTSHRGFCIHGMCKYMEDLQEPVCVCMKGFGGERCGIQTLEVRNKEKSEAEVVQTVLVVIAVVLSVISCSAILLMTCAHYRTHKNFLAAYLGTGGEQEKLQKPISDVMV